MKMIFNLYGGNKTHFHNKGFALSLVLKVRFFGTRKWPIPPQGLRDNRKSRKLVAKGGNYVSHELLIACRFPLFGLATIWSKLLKTLSYLSLNGLSILLCSPHPLSKLLVIQDYAEILEGRSLNGGEGGCECFNSQMRGEQRF